MMPAWHKLALKIDALSLRERALVLATAAVLLLFLFYNFGLSSLYAKQTALVARMAQQQNQMSAIDVAIAQKLQAFATDPNAGNRLRLQKLKLETERAGAALRVRQKGLLAPDKMVLLLENILQRHGQLRLVSLKTLPASPMGAGAEDMSAAARPGAGTAAAKAPEIFFRHGVEITVQGSYSDLLAYMAALEVMPVQLFWGKAKMNVDEYPLSSLTLTVYTVSLDKKWMKL